MLDGGDNIHMFFCLLDNVHGSQSTLKIGRVNVIHNRSDGNNRNTYYYYIYVDIINKCWK